jgi:hypothetical protein
VTGARKVDAGNRAAHSPVPRAKAAMSGSLSLYGKELGIHGIRPSAESGAQCRILHQSYPCGDSRIWATGEHSKLPSSAVSAIMGAPCSDLHIECALPLRHKRIKSRMGTPRRALDCERRGSPCRPGARRSQAVLALPRGPRPLRRQPR